jgi:hypothetical protein
VTLSLASKAAKLGEPMIGPQGGDCYEPIR